MRKSILQKVLGVLFLSVLFIGGKVSADTSVNFRVNVGPKDLYNKSISVSACDSDNDGNVDNITAYCALMQSGLSVDGSFSSYGYFINSIGGVNGYADEGGSWHYWEFYTNGSYASVGVASYILSSGDEIVLSFLDPSSSDIAIASSSKGGGVLVKDTYSKDKALDFIYSKQEDDGSFGESLYTDWIAIGIAKESEKEKAEEDSSTEISPKDKLKNYLEKERFEGLSVTDYERHAMALMSLHINPYNGAPVNYIEKIVKSFDGEQIGDKNLINDDIFGLIVLQNAGYSKDDKIISKLISHIISKQNLNGSWGGSVDMTSASIMALYDFKDIKDNNEIKNSIRRGFKYIKSNENTISWSYRRCYGKQTSYYNRCWYQNIIGLWSLSRKRRRNL